MIGKNLEVTSMQALFLLTLYKSPSLSGSEIVQKIVEDIGEEWSPSPGATYKIINSLEKKGLIRETTVEENIRDKRLRTYSLTPKGQQMVMKIVSRLNKVVVFVSNCCPNEYFLENDK